MGLFGGDKKTTVSAAALHLVDASTNTVKDAVLYALLQNEPIPSTILKTVLKGMGIKMRRVREYANTTYPLGLPKGENFALTDIDGATIKPYILGETGYPYDILVTKGIYSEFSPEMMVYPHLVDVRGYDDDSQQVANWPPGTVFTPIPNEDVDSLPRMVQVQGANMLSDGVTARITYDLWVYRPVITRVYTGSRYTASTSMEWVLDPFHPTEDVAVAGAPYTWDDQVLFAVYKEKDESGTILDPTKIWIYHISDGTYPALHPSKNTQVDEFLPVVPIRYENNDYTDPAVHNTPPDPDNLWSTSKELLDLLGMDFEDLGNKVNQNPSVAEIDHAYVLFGVDVQTDHQHTLAYLTEFFDNMAQIQNKGETGFLADLADPSVANEPYTEYKTDNIGNFNEKGLRLEMKFDYVTSSTAPGTIGNGAIGNATKSIGNYPVTVGETVYNNSLKALVERITSQTRWQLVLKHQYADNMVKTVVVHNLRVFNYVYNARGHAVMTHLDTIANDPDNHNMIIPLQYNLLTSFSTVMRNSITADCALMVLNSYETTTTKWYESDFFKVVLIVIAVVIIVLTGQVWVAGLLAAATAGTITLIMYIINTFLIMWLIDLAMDWVIKEFGTEIGIVGAVVLVITAAVLSKGFGMAGDPSSFLLKTAGMMVQGASALVSSANEFLVEGADDIVNEYEAFMDRLDGLWDELEELEDLAGMKAHLNPLTFARPTNYKIVPNETPTTFFARCLRLPDNTMHTIHHEIRDFCDARISLPQGVPVNVLAMNSRV